MSPEELDRHLANEARLQKENDYLKKMLRDNSICPYGALPPGEPMAKCPSGFPGCACADDVMAEEE